jgi:hypothetical protein
MKSAVGASDFRVASSTGTLVLGALLSLGTTTMAAQGMAIAAAGQGSNYAQTSIEHVRGVVLNAVDKKPVARVLVSSQDQRMAAMTDTEGRFAFDVRRVVPDSNVGNGSSSSLGALGPAPGTQVMTIYLTARRPGYLPMLRPLRLSSDPQTTSEDIELKIVPEGVIAGHLSASDGQTPAGVNVLLRRREVQDGMATWIQAGGTQANGRGEFRFAELQAGEYKIMTSAWTEAGYGPSPAMEKTLGYAPVYSGDGTDLASAMPIHVAAGGAADVNLNLHATTFYRIAIPVVNATQQSGVGVRIGNDDGSSALSLSYNSQTQRVEGFLPDGAYTVQILSLPQQQPPQNSATGTGRVEVSGGRVKTSPITLAPSGTIPVIVHESYTAHPQDQTAGRIIFGGGNSFNGAGRAVQQRSLDISLQSLEQAGRGANLKNTPGNEDLILENVQEGSYRVRATAFRGYIASLTSNGMDLMRQPLVVGPHGASAPIEVTILDDGATLTGSVTPTDGANSLPPGAEFSIGCISLDSSFGSPMQQTVSGSGNFMMQNLAPGRYLVLAFHTSPMGTGELQQLEYRNEDVLRAFESKGTVVTLTSGQQAEIQVPLISSEEN